MRPAQFVLRFDDICPTMDWKIWAVVEGELLAQGLSPILAVVPDNRDAKLVVSAPDARFWDRVREWQQRGWTIALHGYQHRYTSGSGGLLGLHAGSEFAGLPQEEQSQKLDAALAIFRRERVTAEAWIAPGHSFDAVTLQLLRDLDIRVISDGFSLWPFTDERGLTWIPQQLWGLRHRSFGVWTVCYHPNEFGPRELERFVATTRHFRSQITSVPAILAEFKGRRRSWMDGATAWLLLREVLLRRRVRKLLTPKPDQ